MCNNNIIKNTFWTTMATIIMAIVQILRLSILARYLEKSDFGIVAILMLILGFSQLFCDLGFATAIMYKKDITRREFSSLYWLQFGLFILMYLVTTSMSSFLADFYEEKMLISLLPIVMIDLPLKAVGRLYEVMLQKTFQFKLMAIRNIIASLSSLIISVVLAIRGYGVYSLVLSTLFNTIVINIWNFVTGYKIFPILFHCSFIEVKSLCKIGIFQTGRLILDYISTKVDIIIMGKMLGTYDLGIYNLAKELILRALDVLNGIANKVALPYFAKMQNNYESLRSNYCKLMRLLSSINIPVCAFMGALSIPIVEIMYGSNYKEVAPLLSILCVWGMFVVVGNPVSNIVISTGKTKMSFLYTIFRLLFFVPCTYILSSISLYAISWGQSILAFGGFFLSWYMLLKKTINLGLLRYLSSLYKSFAFFIFVVLTCYFFTIFLNNKLDNKFLCYTAIVFTYFSLLALFIFIVDKKYVISFLLKKEKRPQSD